MPSPPPSAHPDPTGILVDFARQGGFAGVSDRMLVRDDGAFTITRLRPRVAERTGHLTATELATLRRVLDAAGFASLPKVQRGRGNDLFTYTVSYHGYQVLAQDGALAPPLRPVVSTLSNLLVSHSA